MNVNGSFEKVGILDSSFAAYIIMRGLFWMAYTLAWLSFAIWKALKKRDYAIPFLCGIILVFAMMERPGLDMWYNFILLYPLAKVACKPGTEPEPAEAAEAAKTAEAIEAVGAVEAVETKEAAPTAEVTETDEAVEIAEAAETVETAEVAETAEAGTEE